MEVDIEEWRRLSARSFGRLLLHPDGSGPFSAEVHEETLEDVHLFDFRSTSHTVAKQPELVDSSDAPMCKLSLQIEGRCLLTQDGRRADLGPGDLALYVTHRPYDLQFPIDQHSMIMTFPRSALHLGDEQLGLVTATRLSRSSGLGRVAVPLFEQLAANLDILTGAHAISLVHSALDILVTVLSAEARTTGRDSSENLLFHRAAAQIDAHLSDPGLAPKAVAAAVHVSLRQLQSRFTEQGLTIAAYIRARRLDAIRRDLSNPILAHESVHQISARYGLYNPSHVSKSFRAEFGESPSELRHRILRTEDAGRLPDPP